MRDSRSIADDNIDKNQAYVIKPIDKNRKHNSIGTDYFEAKIIKTTNKYYRYF